MADFGWAYSRVGLHLFLLTSVIILVCSVLWICPISVHQKHLKTALAEALKFASMAGGGNEGAIPLRTISIEDSGKACDSDQKYSNIDCLALMEGDQEELKRAKLYMEFYPEKIPNDLTVVKMTKNCIEYKNNRQYRWGAGSTMEANFSIAYSILIHKDAAQIERLLRILYQPQNLYCLHIDAKSPESFHAAIQSLVDCFPNIFVTSKLEAIASGGYSRLQADVNCMKDLIDRGKTWKYLINLTGQSLPLRTNRELVRILQLYNGANNIKGKPLWYIPRLQNRRKWQETNKTEEDVNITNAKNVSHSSAPYGIQIIYGSSYGVFTRAFVEFVLSDKLAQALLEWSRCTWGPSEFYWATLNHIFVNPQLKTPRGYRGLPGTNLWDIVYDSEHNHNPCHSRDVHNNCILGIEDLPLLIERKELFAKRFLLDNQYLVFECLEKWLHNKSVYSMPMQVDFYQHLPFISPEYYDETLMY